MWSGSLSNIIVSGGPVGEFSLHGIPLLWGWWVCGHFLGHSGEIHVHLSICSLHDSSSSSEELNSVAEFSHGLHISVDLVLKSFPVSHGSVLGKLILESLLSLHNLLFEGHLSIHELVHQFLVNFFFSSSGFIPGIHHSLVSFL